MASGLRRLLDRLEAEFANGSDGVRNLLAVSFLESLPFEGEPNVEVREMLGPHLKAELERMGL
jgi:hypothetical protein